MISLREIANWQKEDSEITIPALQRGLVWNPSQVELFWDSVLRGFPIGAFTLISYENSEIIELFDGQQRSNAIALAFKDADQSSISELWLDINPPSNDSTTRQFWFKITTMSQPWGYENNDECKYINVSKRREALQKFGKNPDFNIYKDNGKENLTLVDTFPIEAGFPIPLALLFKAIEKNNQESADFASVVEELYNDSKRKYAEDKPFTADIRKKIKNYEYYLKNAYKTKIAIVNTSLKTNEDVANLELIFTRLNKQNTPISKDDLIYSAIKAYWPDIKKENEEAAEHYMQPSKLIQFAFRLIKSIYENSFTAPLELHQIRALANNDQENFTFKEDIISLYKYNINRILHNIDDILDIRGNADSIPTFIRISIINSSPDLYYLLMYLAYTGIDCDEYEDVKAIAFYIHLFIHDKKMQNVLIKKIFENLNKKQSIKDAFFSACCNEKNKSINIPIFTKKQIFSSNEYEPSYNLEDTMDIDSLEIFYALEASKDPLLIAERKYLNEHFDKFNPVERTMWNGHDVPWDYDHIVPKSWVKKNLHRKTKQLIGCLGNYAAIPFEINRSKNNNSDWDHYKDNKSTLLFNEKLIEANITERSITTDSTAKKFAELTLERWQKIFDRIYEILKPIDFNNINETHLNSNPALTKRNEFFRRIESNLKKNGYNSTIKYHNQTYKKDYEFQNIVKWSEEWISLGIEKANNCFACVSMSLNQSNSIEIGIRKSQPTKNNGSNLRPNTNSYTIPTGESIWHYYRNLDTSKNKVEDIAKEIIELSNYI